MKIKLLVIFLVISVVFGAVGCTTRSRGGKKDSTETGRPQTAKPVKPVELSSNMFDGLYLNTKNIKSLGIAKLKSDDSGNNNSSKDYLVSIDSSGKIEKVVFRTTVTDTDGDFLTQENIKAEIDKLFVTKNFIYLMYLKVKGESYGGNYHKEYYRSNDSSQSFVIHRSSGKIYSMAELNNFSIDDNDILTSGYSNYYSIGVKGAELLITDLVPNKNINVRKVVVDKFGTRFINNNISDSVTTDSVFYTNKEIYLDKDGYAYEVTYYTIKRYNSDRIATDIGKGENITLTATASNQIVIRGRLAFHGSIYYTEIKRLSNDNEWKNVGSFKTSPEEDAKSFAMYDNQLFVVAELGNGFNKLVFRDLSTIDPNMDYYYSDTAPNSQEICEATSVEVKDGMLFAINELPNATHRYKVSKNSQGKYAATLVAEITYGQNVLTVQPLN